MASPQLENGYVKIANELLDSLINYRMAGEQMQCFLFILRKTYGWGKKQDAISLSQFVKATGIKKQNVTRALNNLSSKKIITVINNDYETGKVYEINKDYNQWQALSKKITLSKMITPVIKNDYKSLSILSTTKETTKETIKDSKKNKCPHKEIVELWNNKMVPLGSPKITVWAKDRQTHLQARWDESEERQNIKWWDGLFEFISKQPYFMGKIEPGPGYDKPFRLTLARAVQSSNQLGVIVETGKLK